MNDEPLGLADCEALGNGWLAQPAGAVSSLAFLVAAVFAGLALRRAPGHTAGTAWLAVGLLAAIGVGSFDYHGWQSAAALWLHDGPIALLLALLALTLGERLWRRHYFFLAATRGRVVTLLVLLLIGGIAYLLGRTGSAGCDPNSWWQWHALWHAIIAAVLGLVIVMTWGGPIPAEPEDSPESDQ